MEHITVITSSEGENRFESISDFKECMRYHGEVEFEWKGIPYSITHPDGMINIGELISRNNRKSGARRRTKCLNM